MTLSERSRLLLFQLDGAGQQVGVFLARFAAIRTAAAVQSRHAFRPSTGATGGERCAPRCIAAVRWAADVPPGSASGSTARAALRESLPEARGLSSEHQKTAQSSSLRPIVFDSAHRDRDLCRSPKLRQPKPDLVAKRGKNFSGKRSSHSAIRWSSWRDWRKSCSRCGLRNLCGATAPTKRWQSEAGMLLLDQLPAPRPARPTGSPTKSASARRCCGPAALVPPAAEHPGRSGSSRRPPGLAVSR